MGVLEEKSWIAAVIAWRALALAGELIVYCTVEFGQRLPLKTPRMLALRGSPGFAAVSSGGPDEILSGRITMSPCHTAFPFTSLKWIFRPLHHPVWNSAANALRAKRLKPANRR